MQPQITSFYCSPYGEEDRLKQQLWRAENEARHWEQQVVRLRAKLAELSELKAS